MSKAWAWIKLENLKFERQICSELKEQSFDFES